MGLITEIQNFKMKKLLIAALFLGLFSTDNFTFAQTETLAELVFTELLIPNLQS